MDGSGDKKPLNTLQSSYHHYRQVFEDRSRLTWQDEARIRCPEIREYIKHLYSDFWKHVDSITRLYFKILRLLNRKRDVESSIMNTWMRYISSPNEDKGVKTDETNSEETDDTSRQGNKSKDNEVVNWYKTRVVRYKTASEFATELRISILLATQEVTSSHTALSLSPVFSLLEEKVNWFTKQAQDLENAIDRLDMSLYCLRRELSTFTSSFDDRLNLVVKKTKPKHNKSNTINKTMDQQEHSS